MLRYSMETTGDSEVTFGQYKNYLFKEVPKDYLEWAITEWSTSSQCSPDLARLARWGRSPKAGSKSLSGLWSQVLEGPGADGQDQATTCGPQRSSSRTAQGEERDTGSKVKDQAFGGIRRFLYGVFGGRPHVYGGGDPRAAGTPQDPADRQDGRGCCKDRRAEGWKFGESVKTTSPISDYVDVDVFGKSTDLKDVEESPLAYATGYNKVSDYEVGRVPHYETEYNLVTDEPYVKQVPEAMVSKLIYGGDYEAARKLSRDETCCNFKKDVKSWAAKVMTALATLVAVWAFPLHAQAPHLIPNVEDVASSNMTYHYRELLWMEPPCTKWSPWQRLDCPDQKQTFGFPPHDVSDDSHLRKLTTWIYSHGVFHGDLGCNCQGDPHVSRGEPVGDDQPYSGSPSRKCLTRTTFHLHVREYAFHLLRRWQPSGERHQLENLLRLLRLAGAGGACCCYVD